MTENFLRTKLVKGPYGVDNGEITDENPLPIKMLNGGAGVGAYVKSVTTLLNAVTTNQTSSAYAFGAGRRTIQASITGAGALSATVNWYGSNTNAASGGVLLASMSLSGTGSDSAGDDIPAEWPYIYCTLSNLTGASAAVTATVGI